MAEEKGLIEAFAAKQVKRDAAGKGIISYGLQLWLRPPNLI
jgi:hypothetical protein